MKRVKPISKERLNSMSAVLREINTVTVKKEDIERIAESDDALQLPLYSAGVYVSAYIANERTPYYVEDSLCCFLHPLEDSDYESGGGCPDKALAERMYYCESDFQDYYCGYMFDRVVVRYDEDGNAYADDEAVEEANRVLREALRVTYREALKTKIHN